ncbi:hypothetical protein HNY73_020126 [Argiope bruennichi]|uniref:Uncharacterized protein n=1 Tax=Argiope bruennichi TaxID=94029 RepID=A0A8T0EA97_ARGBR|nr:hypothetical protein HNY73_020126 [Argiope bruennichi]
MWKAPRFVETDNILTSALDVPELHRAAKKFLPTKDDIVLANISQVWNYLGIADTISHFEERGTTDN